MPVINKQMLRYKTKYPFSLFKERFLLLISLQFYIELDDRHGSGKTHLQLVHEKFRSSQFQAEPGNFEWREIENGFSSQRLDILLRRHLGIDDHFCFRNFSFKIKKQTQESQMKMSSNSYMSTESGEILH